MSSRPFYASIQLWGLLCGALTTGCLEVKTYRPPPPGGAVEAPVSFTELERRADTLLSETEDGDQRDRLLEAKDLMVALRGADPVAQRAAARYLDRLLTIEERGRTQTISADPGAGEPPAEALSPVRTGGIEEVPLSPPSMGMTPIPGAPLVGPVTQPVGAPVVGPAAVALTAEKPAEKTTTSEPSPAEAAPAPSPTAAPAPSASTSLSAAQSAFDAKKWRDTLTALEGQTGAEADALRSRSVDALIREERERAGHLVVEARSLPSGAARAKKLDEATAILKALLEAYPDSPLAPELQDNLKLVEGVK